MPANEKLALQRARPVDEPPLLLLRPAGRNVQRRAFIREGALLYERP
jgi:hypothetical protein